MNSDLKVAIITGGGTGIGKSTSLALLESGYCVVIAGRRTEKLQEVIDAAKNISSEILAIQTDVTNPSSVNNLFCKTNERFGRLDLLFNNAGKTAPYNLLEDLTYDEWQSVVDVNLTAPFLCTQAAFKQMKNQLPMGGRIINNASVSGESPRPDSAPYTATKHAITGLTKSTSLDGRKYNIACGQINVGNAKTDMTNHMSEGIKQADGKMQVEPTMDVSNVANAVIYMANMPLDANVLSITVMASKMPLVGRG